MKIIVWNVNGIRACLKKGLLDFLKKENPDVFCVQETKAYRDQVELSDNEFGFDSSVWSEADKKGYSGTASFFKVPPLASKTKIGKSKFDTEGRFVISDLGDFLLYNIYFPNGAASDERHNFKMEFLEMLYKQIRKDLKNGKELVVVGDYNIAHSEIDIHDPVRLKNTSGFRLEEREWMTKFFDLGMTDVFRYLNPNKKDAYTWWSYRAGARERNKGWRIDYISVSSGLKDKVSSFKIHNETLGSDHCPISLKLNV
ncbi:MAG: exodeoxyribonuclease III [Bdellovibrionales bacterium]